MKRKTLILFSTVTLIILLISCGNSENTKHADADYWGAILEVGDYSIVIGDDDINPAASYPAPIEVFIDDSTEFTGEISSMEQLKEEFEEGEKFGASLWIKEKGNNNAVNYQVLSKIYIE